jgi:penicillin-binding protein 1C
MRARRVPAWVRWLGTVLVLAVLGVASWVAQPIPASLLAPEARQTLTIEDRHGLVLRSTRAADGNLVRWVPLTEMDPDLLRAFVAVEDRRFYEHHGVDPRSILRAARDNFERRRVVAGASTLTMQLARLITPIDRSWTGKALQAVWAFRLEAHLDKQEILEQYLNRVPLGQGTVGVSAATALYFGASPSRVSLGQAAMLAALARAPSSQNPLVDPARAVSRRRLGLEQLRASGYASDDEVERADLEPLLGEARDAVFLAPHFTSRILQWADRDGIPLAGTWRTSVDLGLQGELESEVRHTVTSLADRGARHAAVVVLDNRSGEVLAWVGSPDFWADTAGQVDMVVNPRQPGSALKPFLYALAFDRGFTASTVLADVPTTFQTSSGPYHPRNYDRNYHGPVRAREALGSSYNVPAVEIADRIGYATLLNGLEQAGFTSLDRSADYYGLGLALGNGDVTLLELANGYRGLANGGVWRPYRWMAEEAGEAGSMGPERRFVSAQAAALVIDVLSDPIARVPGFGLETPFDFPFRVAAKTGTSRHFTDNWAVGVTANFTVAVWVGNFSGRPMQGVSGVSGAGPLLNRAVLLTAKRYAPGNLVTPREAGLVPVRICRVSGMLAATDCPGATEWFVPGKEPAARCDWHRDGLLVLPAEYADWEGARLGGSADGPLGISAGKSGALVSASAVAEPPSRRVADPPLQIVSPQDGDRYSFTPGTDPRYATIALRSAGTSNAVTRWFVDGQRVLGPRWRLVSGQHRFRAEAGGAFAEAEIIVDGPGPTR